MDVNNTEKPELAFQRKAVQDFRTQQEATPNPQQGIVSEDRETAPPPQQSTFVTIDDAEHNPINKTPLVSKHGFNEGDETGKSNPKPGMFNLPLAKAFTAENISQPRELAYHLVIQPTSTKMVS
jgi:hypothetical protein